MKKGNTPRIETQRLILRKFSEHDIDDIFLIFSDKEVNRFLPWFPLESLDEAADYLHNNICVEYAAKTAYRYAIACKESGRVIGYVSLSGINEKNGSGDLGYGLLRKFWNKGIMTEAAAAVLQKLKGNGFEFITATHDTDNPGSAKVMEKIGMTYLHSYDEQWQPKNILVTFNLYRIDFSDCPVA